MFRTGIAVAGMVLCGANPSYAAKSYEFCVTHTSASGSVDSFGARYRFGDIDPGEEVARVLVSQKNKRADTQSVGVGTYDRSICGEIREDTNIVATAEQLGQLGQAVARGDLPAVAVSAVEIVTGASVTIIEKTGDVGSAIGDGAKKAGEELGKLLPKISLPKP